MAQDTQQTNVMPIKGHIRALMVLGLPIVGGHLGQMAIGITDVVMVGWYGIQELAAITLGATYFHLLMLVGSCFGWAVMPMVAAFDAEEDETGLRRATRMGMWLSLVFAAVTLPMMIFAEPILLLLRQEPLVAQDAAIYLRIAGWGIVPALAVVVIKSYLAALEITRPVLWIILLSAVLNAAVNWGLIFGNFGAPELGLAGAAWASLATHGFTLVCVVIYAQRRLPEHEIFHRFWRIDAPMMRKVFTLGWPIGLTTLSEAGLFAASAMMMGWIGTIPLAAHGIVVQLASITFVVHLGLSNAATVRAGNAVGRKDPQHLLRGAMIVMAASMIFGTLTVIAFLGMPKVLIGAFLDQSGVSAAQVLAIGVTLMIAAAMFQMVDAAQVIALGVLRGMQDTKVPMVMAAISYWGIGVPCSYLFGFTLGWGGFGVWMGLVLGLALAAILLVGRFVRLIRRA